MGRFRDRMDEELRRRGYSANTRACYLRCVRHFVRHFMLSPDQLSPERRFLLQVLPARFVRIRHYGWLANAARGRLLPTVRAVLGASAAVPPAPPAVADEPWEATLLRLIGKDVTRCPRCGAGGFLIVEVVRATAEAGSLFPRVRSP
jgi:hypothetical protein